MKLVCAVASQHDRLWLLELLFYGMNCILQQSCSFSGYPLSLVREHCHFVLCADLVKVFTLCSVEDCWA